MELSCVTSQTHCRNEQCCSRNSKGIQTSQMQWLEAAVLGKEALLHADPAALLSSGTAELKVYSRFFCIVLHWSHLWVEKKRSNIKIILNGCHLMLVATSWMGITLETAGAEVKAWSLCRFLTGRSEKEDSSWQRGSFGLNDFPKLKRSFCE